MASKQMLENLEQKFGLAKSLVDDLNDLVEDFTTTDLTVVDSNLPTTLDDSPIINIANLKSDFQLVRQNIIKLVNNGQRVLEEISQLDVCDLKPSAISAISELQNSVGNNLKLLISTYKDMVDIDKLAKASTSKTNADASGVVNNTQNNTTIFAGSSSQLLDLLAQNKAIDV